VCGVCVCAVCVGVYVCFWCGVCVCGVVSVWCVCMCVCKCVCVCVSGVVCVIFETENPVFNSVLRY